MKTFPVLCLLLFVVSIASAFQTSDWVKFNSTVGNFSVLLPKPPTEQKNTTPTPYPSYTSTVYTASVTGQQYLVGWVDYEPSYVFNEVKGVESNRDSMVRPIKRILHASTTTTFGTYQGLHFTGEFLVGDREFLFKAKVVNVGIRP